MIIRENVIKIGDIEADKVLELEGYEDILKNALFFDLEHYVYKKPICIGVFGCCLYNEEFKEIRVTQYMIERQKEIVAILHLTREYFESMYLKENKKYIVTFSGNNDFTVVNHLFKKYKIDDSFQAHYKQIDIQKVYEKFSGVCTGLKTLEKKFDIIREAEPMSGSNLAKTFSKIIKDNDYITRMPPEKIEKILLYNEQDVVNLFHICANWNKYIEDVKQES